MPSAFTVAQSLTLDLASGLHDFGLDTLKAALTNTAPTAVQTTWNLTDHPAPAAANGYPAGGATLTVASHSQVAGVYALIVGDAVYTPTAGGIGPFQYVVIYNASQGNRLVGWLDAASPVTVDAGATWTVLFSEVELLTMAAGELAPDTTVATLNMTIGDAVLSAPAGSEGGFVTFPSAELDFLLGPSTDPATDTENAAFVRFSANTRTDALSRGLSTIGTGELARVGIASTDKAGTISHTAASTSITGSGTSFTTDVQAGDYIFIWVPAGQDIAGEGYWHMQLVSSVVSDTSLTIHANYSSTLPALSAVAYRRDDTSILGSGPVDVFTGNVMYYDFGFAMYQAAYKHAAHADGATLMARADAVAKQWWGHPVTATARRAANPAEGGSIWIGSRYEALGTLMPWALRGCPGATHNEAATATAVWEFCYDAATAAYNQWLAGKGAIDAIYFDTRDGGYALHWLVMLAKVHPTPAVRADCLTKALDSAIDYFIRLQYADGTFRTPNDAWWNATTDTQGYPAMQPALVALLLNALIDLHRLIEDDVTYATEAATIATAIVEGTEGLILGYAGWPNHDGYTAVTGSGNAEPRAMTYVFGGSDLGYDATSLMPPIPADPNGLRWNDPKINVEWNVDTNGLSLAEAVTALRFNGATIPHVPYYAALIAPTLAEHTRYLAFGDELMKAQWEYTDGDGYRSQWYTAFPKNKDWNEHTRAQMRGLGWRRLALERTF